ncbi:hypothetical protein DH2020_048313 [Rehmannia glutinosa]|uniref:Reverse transcriptase n=1 Tax=Rehmannia glutinosa TaxID=99300 RepID=A0ABR0U606_REHGL
MDIEKIAPTYFNRLFASCNPTEEILAEVLNAIEIRASDEMNQQLQCEFTKDEVTKALFQMFPIKSPGPDGYPALFFQKYWNIVGNKVIKASLDFLNLGILDDNVLSSMLTKAEKEGRIKGVRICRGAPTVSHLLFADDTMIFCEATSESAKCIKDILRLYSKASGQEINFQKSTIVFTENIDEIEKLQIQSILQVQMVDKHDKYLGLSGIVGRSKKECFAQLRDRVWNRLQGYNEKLLSRAGKEILVKSAVQAIPTFAMSCFLLPKTLLKEIESLIAAFWWGSKGQDKIHWVSWGRLCDSKRDGDLD